MGEIIIKFVAIHCSLTTLYHRLGQQLFTACASFLVAAFHGMCIVFGSGFPRLFTACASFLAAAFHGMCIVFGSGFPRLSTTCASFLAAAFHGLCIVFGSGFPRLSTTCAPFLAAAFHGMCIVFGSGFPRLSTTCASFFGSSFPRLSTTCASFFCVFRGQYGSIAGCGPCGRPPLQFPDFVNASPIFNQPYSFLTKPNKTLAVTQGLRPLFLLRLRLAPKQASASRSRRRNSLRSSGLHHSKKNLENKPEEVRR